MTFSTIRRLALALVLLPASTVLPNPAAAEGMNCLISRGNLCFHTGCDNRAKSQRITLDLGQGNFRVCPNRFNDTGCTDIPMTFEIRDNAIIGTALAGPEFAARSMFVNRVTGAFTNTLVSAGGVAAVDFGNCEVRR
jgi:hypothetical protein